MNAINWFEVFLPSRVFEVAVECLDSTTFDSRRQKSVEHRTVLRSDNGGETRTLYHITASPPESTQLVEKDLEKDPSLAKYIIEHGFASQLQKAGFEVRLKHVGGVAYRSVGRSIRPSIYQSREGIKFRCFYFSDRDVPPRWGLILSYMTGQRFNISLTDRYLRQLAIGRRVVHIGADDEETIIDEVPSHISQRSGILESVQGDKAVVMYRDGTRKTFPLSEWTLPCSRGNLLDYIRTVESDHSASEVAIKLLQDSLALTPAGRMNTSLARDQLGKLRSLMDENDLFTFTLPLPGLPVARLSQGPLQLGR